MIMNFDVLLGLLSRSLEIIGALIIAGGSAHALWTFIAGLCGFGPYATVDSIRIELGRTVVLAIEFLMAADIVYTIVTPNYYEIGMLGCLVIIRTILTFFLNQELIVLRNNSNN